MATQWIIGGDSLGVGLESRRGGAQGHDFAKVGVRIDQTLHRLQASGIPDGSSLILSIGTNDALENISQASIAKHTQDLLNYADAHHLHVVWVGPPGSPNQDYNARLAQTSATIQGIITQHNKNASLQPVVFVGANQLGALHQGGDHIHPSGAGYQNMLNAVYHTINGAPPSATPVVDHPAQSSAPPIPVVARRAPRPPAPPIADQTAPTQTDTTNDAGAAAVAAATLGDFSGVAASGSNYGVDRFLFGDSEMVGALRKNLGLPDGGADADLNGALKKLVAGKLDPKLGYTPSAGNDFTPQDVAALQRMLKDSGQYAGNGRGFSVDGKFGLNTQNALRQYLNLSPVVTADANASAAPATTARRNRSMGMRASLTPAIYNPPAGTPAGVTPANLYVAVNYLDQAGAPGHVYDGQCATHVREALNRAGVNLDGHPVPASDYINYLDNHAAQTGLARVQNWNERNAQIGDVIVFDKVPGHDNGHMEMVVGFNQSHEPIYSSGKIQPEGLYPSSAYRARGAAGFVVYRMQPGTSALPSVQVAAAAPRRTMAPTMSA